MKKELHDNERAMYGVKCGAYATLHRSSDVGGGIQLWLCATLLYAHEHAIVGAQALVFITIRHLS